MPESGLLIITGRLSSANVASREIKPIVLLFVISRTVEDLSMRVLKVSFAKAARNAAIRPATTEAAPTRKVFGELGLEGTEADWTRVSVISDLFVVELVVVFETFLDSD